MLPSDAIDFLAEICEKFTEGRPHLEGHPQDMTTSRLENFANFTTRALGKSYSSAMYQKRTVEL
jgi:hypothetical protein